MQQGKDPQRTHPHYQSKYHCYVAYFEIFSLDGNLFCVLLGPAGRTTISFHPFSLSFFICSSSEALPTCVIVWPLSACLLQSAVLRSSPRPYCSLNASLPILVDWLPSSPAPAKSSSFRTGPPVLNLLLLLRQSVLSNLLCLCFLQGSLYPEMEMFYFSWFHLWICHCVCVLLLF